MKTNHNSPPEVFTIKMIDTMDRALISWDSKAKCWIENYKNGSLRVFFSRDQQRRLAFLGKEKIVSLVI